MKLLAGKKILKEMNLLSKEEYQSYQVSMGIRVQITEQTRETYRGGGVIPAVIPRLRTNSKYSRAPMKTAAEKATVKIQPPANTTPPAETPTPRPNTILFLS